MLSNASNNNCNWIVLKITKHYSMPKKHPSESEKGEGTMHKLYSNTVVVMQIMVMGYQPFMPQWCLWVIHTKILYDEQRKLNSCKITAALEELNDQEYNYVLEASHESDSSEKFSRRFEEEMHC